MGLSIEVQDWIAGLNQRADQAEKDAMVLAGRLMLEDKNTMSPETLEALERWSPKVMEALGHPVKKEDWCPGCGGRDTEIEEIRYIKGAQSVGEADGSVLKCECGHTWRV